MDQNYIERIKKEIDEVHARVWKFRGVTFTDFDPLEQAHATYEKAKEINYVGGIGRSLLGIGMGTFIIKQDAPTAIRTMTEALEVFREIKDQKWMANSYLTIGIVHNTVGNREAALYNALRGFDFYETNTEDKDDLIMAHYILGTIYKDLKKYREAEALYLKGIEISGVEISAWGGRIFAGLTGIYTDQGLYDQAVKMGMRSLEVLEAEKNRLGESRALTELGVIYKKQGKYGEALEFLFKGLAIREENKTFQFVLGSLSEIADVYKALNEKEKALDYLLKAEAIAEQIAHHKKLGNIQRDIAAIYKSSGDFEKALLFNEKFLSMTLELHQKETEQKINTLQSELLQDKEKEIERLRNVELKHAYGLISEKNKEITDSIHYARRIQKALLASDELLQKQLPPHFIFYRPKDIVSGDFYWAVEKDSRFYLAVCDSTGHGVPGAFMSLLNISFLNEAIIQKNIVEPHLIFNHVRQRLIETISQEGAKDGMDGILLCIEKNKKRISYCAANNEPVSVIGATLTEHKADKMPVGKGENAASFSKGEIELQPGTMLYLFTDGYADQFGGAKGKKFRQKALRELLSRIAADALPGQQERLEHDFLAWKGDLEQVDDVLVIGIRF